MKTRNKLKIMGLLLTLVMTVSLLGMFSLTATAAEGDVASVTVGETTTNYTSLDDALIAAQNNPGSTLREPQEIVQVDGADGDYEASVTTGAETVNYEELTEAIEAAKANSGATLKLLKDIGTNVLIDGGTFIFDLNGHTIAADTKFDSVAPYTNQFAMNILKDADITLIGSGSIISNGPNDPQYTTWLYCIRNQGTLTINGPMQIRTNGYTYNSGIYSYGGTLTIHNCNIEVRRYAVEGNSGAQVTINGGSFAGDIGVYGGGNAAVNINGGTITGSSYDVFISNAGGLASVKLGIGSGGAGPSFPGGLSINNLVGLSDLLNPNYYYMINGNPVDMTAITTEMVGGDVSVGYCDHSSNINGVPVADDATHHSLFCSNCQARIKQEQHSITGSVCTGCGYGCSHPDVVMVNGVVKCAACPVVMVAQVGDSYYARLSDAVAQANAVNGSTLTLLSDVKGDIVVDPGRSFTLDLNGKTLRGTGKSVITIGMAGGSGASLIMKSSVSGGKVTGCYHQNAQGTVVVNTWSTFTMESGVISENMVDSGGGVYVVGGTFNMKGGEISGNTADWLGGGVILVGTSASFTMDGGSIRSNTVTIDDKNREMEGIFGGGGVYVDSGTFTMNAGTISGNSSTYTRGGGVQVAQGTFVMNGGTIEGNSAAEKGGGVYVMKGENGNPSGTFTVGGSSVITGNTVNGSANNVYLAVPLTIGSNLSTTAGIGITGSTTPTDTGVEIASSGATEINKSAFISDNINYSIVQKEGKLYLYPHIHNWTYTADCSTITATCKAEDCYDAEQSITISAEGKTYDGTPVTATLDGSIDGVAAPEITYSGNTNAGTYTASITLGDATASVEFTITKAKPEAHNFSATLPTDRTYNGEGKAVTITVNDGIVGMGEITVKYLDADLNPVDGLPTNQGVYQVAISVAEGTNYTANNELYLIFDIFPFTLGESNIVMTPQEFTYNGAEQKPTIAVLVDDKILVLDEDYTITWDKEGFMNAGTYTATIKGIGNYQGTGAKSYVINPKPLVGSDISIDITEETYDGSVHTPVITVKDGEKTLIDETDYEISWDKSGFVNADTYTATIKGKGNYSGEFTRTFEIKQAELEIELTSPITAVLPGNQIALTLNTNSDATPSWTFNNASLVSGTTIKVADGLVIGQDKVTITVNYPETTNVKGGSKTIELEVGMADFSGAIADLETEIAELNDLIANKADATTVNQKLNELLSKIEALEEVKDDYKDADATLKSELESAIATAKQQAIDAADSALDTAKAELNEAIANKADKTELEQAISTLNTAITNAETVAKTYADTQDAALKQQLETAIATAKSEAIASAETLVNNAKTDLQNAIDTKADTATLNAKVDELNDAIETAETVAKAYADTQDAALKSELEAAIATAKSDLEALIGGVQSELDTTKAKLDKAIEDLNKAITDGDKELSDEIAALNTALTNAKAALEKADADNKAELVGKIETADATLDAAIKAVQKNLDDAKTELDTAIKNGDTALDGKISNLNAALESAKAALEATDAANKTELEGKITDAQTSLQAAIDNVQTNLDSAKAELDKAIADLDAAMKQGDADLSTEITALNAALTNAKAALEKADADNKAELVSKIETADATLDAAIKAVQKNLDDAQAALNKAIADGDTALDGRITDLNTALETAKAALEATDAANKTELEGKITEAQTTLQSAIDKVAKDLADAEKELADAIASGDAALGSRISSVSASLSAAKTALEKADADNKAELIAKIETAEATLDAAIKAVQKNLDDAKTALEKALADGDKANADALAQAISDLNAAIEAAETAAATADGSLKTELTSKIDNADAALQAAIDALSSELNSVKQALENKDAELDAKDSELQTFIIIVCVISSVALCGSGAFVVWFFIDRKKRI